MTDTFDLAAMIADREKGTPGPWVVPDQTYRRNLTVELDIGPDDERRFVECPGTGGSMSFTDEICTLGWMGADEWLANARRIARIPEMEAEILRLAHIAEAATAVIAKYDEMNPMRTADYHVDCDCLRCKVDDLKEALSHD